MHSKPMQADQMHRSGCCFPITTNNRVGTADGGRGRWAGADRLDIGEWVHILVERSLLLGSVSHGGIRVHDMVKKDELTYGIDHI